MEKPNITLLCPACGYELSEIIIGNLAVDVCLDSCGGIWFDNGEMPDVDDLDKEMGEALTDIEHDPACIIDYDRKRSCPRCDGIFMLKHQFSPLQTAEIDECPACGGIWLDNGELKSIRETFKSDDERLKAETYISSMISAQVSVASAHQARKTKSFHAVAKFLGHMWHDYGLNHFRGRDWPPWRGSFRD